MTERISVFNIPLGVPFVDALAEGIMARHGATPMTLGAVTLLVPNRRAARALGDAFLRLSEGRPLLLPRIRALQDVDEDALAFADDTPLDAAVAADLPQAVSALDRQLLLARLIALWEERRHPAARPTGRADRAARLAADLARFIDQVHTARLDFKDLDRLAPADYAGHWQETLRFLAIAGTDWPQILAERGRVDPADWRNRALSALAEAWRRQPPDGPVIAAGSTGSVPATAELLAVIARLPQGAVVLPGLDTDCDSASWDVLEESHPQYGLKHLLERLGIDRAAVRVWPAGRGERRARARARLLTEVMRPQATTDSWASRIDIGEAALDGLQVVACPDSPTEARVIAVAMREALQHAGRSAALVTSDRALARRVASALRRWGLEIDDSAGRPLAHTPVVIFLLLIATVAATGAPPIPLLALLKHPLAAGGGGQARFRARARQLERLCLRGPRPAPGLAGIARALDRAKKATPALKTWFARVRAILDPLALLLSGPPVTLDAVLEALIIAAEALGADADRPGSDRLWTGEDGEALAGFLTELHAGSDILPAMPGAEIPALLDALLEGRVVRPRFGSHPRLHIWGPLEARLQQADLMILGGLNEGVWPRDPTVDPWLSRPMRRAFGLPAPETVTGLAAHDFAQAFCAPDLLLTRSAKQDGVPTVRSRWLVRLDTVLTVADHQLSVPADRLWLPWQATLDAPNGPPRPIAPPTPRPPVSARPRALSVTRIEAWMRDPYEIYARHILKLRALDPIDAAPGAAEYGTMLHKALERFIGEIARPGATLPDDAEPRLLAIGREEFANTLDRPDFWAFWWPRFRRVAHWVVAHERARAGTLAQSFCELRGTLDIPGPAGVFRLSAIADRIDMLNDGSLAIIDYKTGTAPGPKEIAAGFAPQLPLEAAIAGAGGFDPVAPAPVSALEFWRLPGGEPAGEIKKAGNDPALLAEEALAGLHALIARYDLEETPYPARPSPDHAPRFSDYEHLARVREWSVADTAADT